MALATFDQVDGHSTRIELDPRRNGIDDEACYAITDYAVGSQVPGTLNAR